MEIDKRSKILFDGLQLQYGFIGGAYSEYVAYLNRSDVDPDLWDWSDKDGVKCIAGVAAVPKKDRRRQRKLLMQVAANYAWCSVDDRTDLGMATGSSMGLVFSPGGKLAVSSWDQSSAFTAVRTPEWMWAWTSGPPVRARDVWHRLPQQLYRRLGPMGWAYPRYTRLAMGSAHAVFILMSIDLEIVGRTLWNYSKLGSFDADAVALSDKLCPEDDELSTEPPGSDCSREDTSSASEVSVLEEDSLERDDDFQWAEALRLEKRSPIPISPAPAAHHPTKTLDEFEMAIRDAKRGSTRTFVVAHLFSGERRPGDFEEFLTKAMSREGLGLVVVSVDLGADPCWDLSNPVTFHKLFTWVCEGLIDALLGGPSCSTWSRLRFLSGGPRPLRFRSSPWGRPDATKVEKLRITEGNTLMLNFMSSAEALSMRGGVRLMEHPADP